MNSRLLWLLVLLLAMASIGRAVASESIAIGLTGRFKAIEGVASSGHSLAAPTVVVVGGLGGDDASSKAIRAAIRRFDRKSPSERPWRLIWIPVANPDRAPLQFPPTGTAYRENPEAQALWRWIGIHGPDLVVVAGDDSAHLAAALAEGAAAEVGRIPARDVAPAALAKLLAQPASALVNSPSDAHRELDRRRARTPQQLAQELARFYGHDFNQPWYINAIALIGQIRLGHLEEVRRLAEPYVDGTKDSLARPNSLVLAGHIVFTELARRTGDPRYAQLVRKVADLGFEPDGTMKESMPYHDQFSDSVFMGTVIVAQAGALTGERRYFDMAARHVAFMQHLDLRADGLYRHQPLTDAAWGRGNAFAAIGLALTLSEFPRDHPAYARLLEDYRKHMAVLARFQDGDGLWRNVIDYPGAYGEYSATAMIGFAMLRGVRSGWLPEKDYRPVIDKAWQAIATRTAAEGRLVDVCESTARMKSLEEYLQRAAILGPDPRGGAMALLFATEMAGLK
jgi:unsaturated rhamnogalacturonyl hydrolase